MPADESRSSSESIAWLKQQLGNLCVEVPVQGDRPLVLDDPSRAYVTLSDHHQLFCVGYRDGEKRYILAPVGLRVDEALRVIEAPPLEPSPTAVPQLRGVATFEGRRLYVLEPQAPWPGASERD